MLVFGLTREQRQKATAEAERSLVRPAPVSQKRDPRLDEYLALAKELRVGAADNGQVLQMEVADFLWEHDVELYDYEEVERYLVALGQRLYRHKELVWKPLRIQDDPEFSDQFPRTYFERRVYSRVVPFEVLKNVKLLDERFGNKIKILVSDFEVPNPDPFIIATARNMDKIVFGAWDEPDFFKDR